MARFTPAEFQARLLNLANERGTVMERATGRAALHIKRELQASAMLRVRRTPRAKPSWVTYKVWKDDDGARAAIHPRGGFAYLGDLGSYKHPNGYPVRQHKRRAKFGESSARRAAWHPAIKAQPWFQSGADRAAPTVAGIYWEAVNAEVHKQFR